MSYSPILGPVVALVAWTLVMTIWMYAVRFPALARKGISLKGRVGSKGGDLDGVVEPEVQWKAHNHNHLMEQPISRRRSACSASPSTRRPTTFTIFSRPNLPVRRRGAA